MRKNAVECGFMLRVLPNSILANDLEGFRAASCVTDRVSCRLPVANSQSVLIAPGGAIREAALPKTRNGLQCGAIFSWLSG
jgi:hypothetical protein